MSKTFERILRLIESNEIMISDHGSDELASDDIFIRDVMARRYKRCRNRRLPGLSQRALPACAAERLF